MGTPPPELKQLWIRVLKRVHPDLAIDEPDRIRCERLTQLANEAYQAGDAEALRAVLSPAQPPIAGTPRAYRRSTRWQKAPPPSAAEPEVRQASYPSNIPPQPSLASGFWLSFSSRRLLFVAIATMILICGGFSLYSVTSTRHPVTSSQTAPVDILSTPVEAHVEVPDTGIWRPSNTNIGSTSGDPSPDPACASEAQQAATSSPPHGESSDHLNLVAGCSSHPQDAPPAPLKTSVANSVEPSHLYIEQMDERLYRSFNDYEHVDANVPVGNSAEMRFDVNRDGSLSNVRIGKPSGWASLDYACVRAVQRTGTVGALPEDYKLRTLPASFACSYNGGNALPASRQVDAGTDKLGVYVGSVRNTTQ